MCVKIECEWFCKPIKGESRTTKTYFSLLIHKNCTYLWKNLDWWARRLFATRLPSVKNNWVLFFVMVIYLENKMERWWKVKEYNGRRRRKQDKISVLYWSIKTRNSLTPSSSRSFRTQSHWSFITGQCLNTERLLRAHLSHRMCDQFTLHREFRTDTKRTNFEQKTDCILHVCGSNEQGT